MGAFFIFNFILRISYKNGWICTHVYWLENKTRKFCFNMGCKFGSFVVLLSRCMVVKISSLTSRTQFFLVPPPPSLTIFQEHCKRSKFCGQLNVPNFVGGPEIQEIKLLKNLKFYIDSMVSFVFTQIKCPQKLNSFKLKK